MFVLFRPLAFPIYFGNIFIRPTRSYFRGKLSSKQLVGVLLLVALVLLFVGVPFVDGKSISALIILGSAIYLLIKG
ncbi:MAG: hypothetical protein CL944_02155 [Candidatus Diapherotrites archaeon]|uniref:Uncharacterized protein n=1 Tax=Candidatus Iainarchaeum sp. TaxID=3101447 RepID=A0A2D6LPZ1_9ARCH|nr:hypothetical protein [Candidatus Diapherotrites archaeon]|tara:strand:- start:9617 stop:9844 length:228 start_codon:yes stop_codon:yes gene_type:complete